MNVLDCNQYILPIKNGDVKAFKELFELMQPLLVRHLLNLTKEVELSEELVNDIFIAFWKNRESTEIKTSLKTYLYKAATYKAYDYYRQKERKPEAADFELHAVHLSNDTKVDDKLNFNETEQRIRSCVQQLPKRCRLIFSLSRFSEYSRKEIAEEMDITLKTVENQITIGTKLMRKCIYENEIWGDGE